MGEVSNSTRKRSSLSNSSASDCLRSVMSRTTAYASLTPKLTKRASYSRGAPAVPKVYSHTCTPGVSKTLASDCITLAETSPGITSAIWRPRNFSGGRWRRSLWGATQSRNRPSRLSTKMMSGKTSRSAVVLASLVLNCSSMDERVARSVCSRASKIDRLVTTP